MGLADPIRHDGGPKAWVPGGFGPCANPAKPCSGCGCCYGTRMSHMFSAMTKVHHWTFQTTLSMCFKYCQTRNKDSLSYGLSSCHVIHRQSLAFTLGRYFLFCFPSWLETCCILQHFLTKCAYFTLAHQHHQHHGGGSPACAVLRTSWGGHGGAAVPPATPRCYSPPNPATF